MYTRQPEDIRTCHLSDWLPENSSHWVLYHPILHWAMFCCSKQTNLEISEFQFIVITLTAFSKGVDGLACWDSNYFIILHYSDHTLFPPPRKNFNPWTKNGLSFRKILIESNLLAMLPRSVFLLTLINQSRIYLVLVIIYQYTLQSSAHMAKVTSAV